MSQIPTRMLKQHEIPNSSLENLKIYSSKGCRKSSQRWILYVANTAILELRILVEDITSDCSFLLRLVEPFTADTEEYYPTCHKIGDAKTFKNFVCGTFVCSTIHFVLTNYMFIYCRLTHLTGVFKKHADSVLHIIGSD